MDLGSTSGCDADGVLYVIPRNAELHGEFLQGLACPESVKDIFHPASSPYEDGRTGRSGRVYHDLGMAIRGHSEELDIAVLGVLESLKTILDCLCEGTLVAADG